MLKHLFKLIWNKKKENFLLISEILISFMVMFAVLTLLIYYYNNYKQPLGFNYDNVWTVRMEQPKQSANKDSITLNHENLKNALLSLPKVRSVSYTSSNTPYSNSMMRTGLEYKHSKVLVDNYNVEASYATVLKMQIVSGKWFSAEDKSAAIKSIVISASAAAKLGLVNPVGVVLGEKNENRHKIIGIVADFKDKGDFIKPDPGMYTLIDTSNVHYMDNILVKVSSDADAAFEGRLYKLIANTQKSSNLEIQHLSEARLIKNKAVILPMVILLVISGFLIFNVALGLFGVLWYNISKRKGEIGLRRAIGATASGVSWQLVGEALVLATFSLIIGSFFAIQFPLLNVFDLPASVYLAAFLLSIAFIYLLVIICALYPGKQAAAIYPAVALHED